MYLFVCILQTGSHGDHHQPAELEVLLQTDHDDDDNDDDQKHDLVSDTATSSHCPHPPCAEDAQSNEQSAGSGVTIAVIGTRDTLINLDADSSELSTSNDHTRNPEDTGEVSESRVMESDKPHASFTPDGDELNVVNSTENNADFSAGADTLDMAQSVEFDKAVLANDDDDDRLNTVECADMNNHGTVSMDILHSPDSGSNALSSAAIQHDTICSVEDVERCRPDSPEPVGLADTSESISQTEGDVHQASVTVNVAVTSPDHCADTVNSLLSQLMLAINSAYSGITVWSQKLLFAMVMIS